MKKYDSDYLVIPEQIDELTPICFDPTDGGDLCFRIHINGQFFMILADTESEAKDYLGEHLRRHFPKEIGHFWAIEEVKKPKVFVQINKIDFVDCINWTEKNNEIVFAGLVEIQNLGSLDEFCLTKIKVWHDGKVSVRSTEYYDNYDGSPYAYEALFFDDKGMCIKDLYFYEWFKNYV